MSEDTDREQRRAADLKAMGLTELDLAFDVAGDGLNICWRSVEKIDGPAAWMDEIGAHLDRVDEMLAEYRKSLVKRPQYLRLVSNRAAEVPNG